MKKTQPRTSFSLLYCVEAVWNGCAVNSAGRFAVFIGKNATIAFVTKALLRANHDIRGSFSIKAETPSLIKLCVQWNYPNHSYGCGFYFKRSNVV